ncbi:DNA recombination protein RmuC [Metamycoplasma alkalescens]|uniref:DNA recombination protein RmuC n=1 Tax=Metamycoplasma alkalescens TaxID=45363 RepID=UPI003CFE9994
MTKELIILLVINIIVALVLIGGLIYLIIIKKSQKKLSDQKNLENNVKITTELTKNINHELEKNLNTNLNSIKDEVSNKLTNFITTSNETNTSNLTKLFNEIKSFESEQKQNFLDLEKKINDGVTNKLDEIDKKNKTQFETIKENIDKYFNDKLTEQVKTQFQNIKTSMDDMNRGMIEFSTIQEAVTNLNKTFSNNKNIGNFGEFNLEQIFQNQFPNLQNKFWFKQYIINDKNNEKVDFVVKSKFLEKDEEKELIIPIDCKFPFEKWNKYLNNELSYVEIEKSIEHMAKDIASKYINLNKKTTPFAILYLPSEYIYLTIVKNFDLVTKIFDKYKIFIQGPSTIIAFIYNLFIQNQNLMISKNIDKIKNLFLDIQKNYKYLNDHINESHKQITKASNSIEKAKKYTNSTFNKINNSSGILNIEAIEIKNELENES